MIYVVASDNSVQFTQGTKILEASNIKDLVDKLQHVKFSETSKMATALGKTTPHKLSNEDYKQLAAAAEEEEEEGEEEEQHNLRRILMQCPEVMSATIHSPELSDIVIYPAIMKEQLAVCFEEDGEEDGKSASISP
ncbi:hypothetical protein HRS9139_03160 [Pyrenophora teres f. teres]|nr:hypothetical protein HRS9139_03160 [Pyrenophora teres f. teres]